MSISARLYRDGRCVDSNLDPDRVDEVLPEAGVLVWLDVAEPTEQDMAKLAEEFGFHELALEDCMHSHQRPKIEQYEGYYFIIFYGAQTGDAGLVEQETAVFVGSNYLVTVRKAPMLDTNMVVERWDARPELTKEGGGYLLYILLDSIVDQYFTVLDAYEDRTEDLEERLIEGADAANAQEIFALKKQLVRFRRSIAPLRDVLDVMTRGTSTIVTRPLEPYYRDVYDHILRVTDYVDSLRDLLATALEAHLSLVSNRLNLVMKSLTSWGAIILVPTLIAGIYGMNFQHMPELGWRYGYPYALGLMLASSFTLYKVFKRRGWL